MLVWLLRWQCCGGGRWRCRGSQTAALSSWETRLFTPLGVSFCFLFSCCQASSPSVFPCLFLSQTLPCFNPSSLSLSLSFSLPSAFFFSFSSSRPPPLLLALSGIYRAKGSGGVPIAALSCAWGVGPSCPATVPG